MIKVFNFQSALAVIFEPRSDKNLFSGFSTRSDTNQAVQPQKMARSLKFWI